MRRWRWVTARVALGKGENLFRALGQDREDEVAPHRVGAASLTHAQVLVDDACGNPPAFSSRIVPLAQKIEDWCLRFEIAPDLANEIGSRRWLRGIGTLAMMIVAAIAFSPDFSAFEPANAAPLAKRARDEYRSQTIAPLALGADSGRHMGPSATVRQLTNAPERPSIELVASLGQGDSLGRILERIGVGRTDGARVLALVSQAVAVDAIEPGTHVNVTLGRRPRPRAERALTALNFRARFDLDISIMREGAGDLVLARRAIRVDETPLRIRGTVGSSLYRSARNAGAPMAAIRAYLQAIDKYVSLESDVRPDDEFDMVLAYKRSARGEHELGRLLYAGLGPSESPRLQLLQWGQSGEMFAASGLAETRTASAGAPVAGRITSLYGMRRHPILGYARLHAGIDYGAAFGSPIYAVADGVVSFAGRHGGHGNYVRLQHAFGLGTGYGHMSRIAVASGARVRTGQVIGYVGSTGLSTGPHLHFEAYRGGRTINPAGLSFASRPAIDGKERDAFKARMKALLTIQPGEALGSIAPAPEAVVMHQREIDKSGSATSG